MLFSSMEFLFLFFPIVLIGYFLLHPKARNYWLLVTSLFFYAWGEPKFVLAMLFSIVCNYVAALAIDLLRGRKTVCKLILALDLVINLGILFVFKYMNIVTGSIHSMFPQTQTLFEQTSFVLPIGISFFTFQALSYVVDVYRGIPARKNPFYVGLYISLFPQLIAGPIVRYTTIMDQIEERTITKDGFCHGVLRFLYGFNKKVLLANLFATVADTAFGADELSVGMAWLGAICYSLQIFFDFSGYSEMAIGLGEMFGFHFLENFNYPYISKTVTEFWRRWHISLGTWFRDYVYFPLGGSRVNSKLRLVFNLAVVWLATGIWHGANWTFLLWGILHGSVIIAEKLMGVPKKVEEKKNFSVVYRIVTLLVVLLGWVMFRAESVGAGFSYIGSMFALNGSAPVDGQFVFWFREYLVILVAGVLCSMPVFAWMKEKLAKKREKVELACTCLGYAVQLILFVVSVSYLVMDAHNPFIYFNF